MTLTAGNKSTNVRLSIALLGTLASALGGCALPQIAVQRDECGTGLTLACTAFGPARSCECLPRTEVDRFLTTLGEPAWLGGIR
jgi:hypothetical protein